MSTKKKIIYIKVFMMNNHAGWFDFKVAAKKKGYRYQTTYRLVRAFKQRIKVRVCMSWVPVKELS